MGRSETCLVVVRAGKAGATVESGEWLRGVVFFRNGGLDGMGHALLVNHAGLEGKTGEEAARSLYEGMRSDNSHVNGGAGLLRNPCPDAEPNKDWAGKGDPLFYEAMGPKGVLTAPMTGTSGLSFGAIVHDPEGRMTIPRIRHIYLFDPNFPGLWFYRGFDLPEHKETFTPLTREVLDRFFARRKAENLRKSKAVSFATAYGGDAGKIVNSVVGASGPSLKDPDAARQLIDLIRNARRPNSSVLMPPETSTSYRTFRSSGSPTGSMGGSCRTRVWTTPMARSRVVRPW